MPKNSNPLSVRVTRSKQRDRFWRFSCLIGTRPSGPLFSARKERLIQGPGGRGVRGPMKANQRACRGHIPCGDTPAGVPGLPPGAFLSPRAPGPRYRALVRAGVRRDPFLPRSQGDASTGSQGRAGIQTGSNDAGAARQEGREGGAERRGGPRGRGPIVPRPFLEGSAHATFLTTSVPAMKT